jgi:putative peptidoglycan lipid II flippase
MKETAKQMLNNSKNELTTHTFNLPSASLFWSLGFVYASLMALLLQKAILPLMPELHAGHGLLQNDAIVFHNMAVDVATRIQASGWSEWQLFPPGATANVSLLAALYALLGNDPAWFIPFNAAAHAGGALLIYRLGPRMWPGLPGQLGGLVAGIAFLTFPSALQWYGQVHKDSFAILGTLLLLEAWLQITSTNETSLRRHVLLLVKAGSGAILLGLVRPYYVALLLLGLSITFMTDIAFVFFVKHKRCQHGLIGRISILILISALTFLFAHTDRAVGVYGENGFGSDTNSSTNLSLAILTDKINWQWHTSTSVPPPLEKALKRGSELRAHFVAFGRSVGASSEIDGDRLPSDALSSLSYLPRALFVGLMAPFPDSWSEKMTAPRLIGAMETAVWYLFFLGTVITIWSRPSRELLAGMVFCGTLLTILSYIHPNVGTLYRQRYGLWHFFMLCGSIGWCSLITKYLQRRHHRAKPGNSLAITDVRPSDQIGTNSSVDKLASAGFVVILITLACYLGFFARDLLMIQQLKMTEELDAFFTAAMIPMIFVTCLAMPMADALTPKFLEMRLADAPQGVALLRQQLGFAIILLGAVTVLVTLFSPWLVMIILKDSSLSLQTASAQILRWFAPIILLSAWTVIGNAALNALARQRDAALGQLFVPIITIILLALTPASDGVMAATAGMLSGTVANLLWIMFRLKSLGILFFPTAPNIAALKPVLNQYRRLLFAATIPAALVPLNYAFASSVNTGAVSGWAFASKIIVLFSGLASVVATAVVLPHLSRLFTESQQHGMRQDANLLLALGSWVGGLLALGGFLFADPLVALALSKNITNDQLVELSNTVKIGIIQLPMAISWALIAKMAIVSGNSSRVMRTAFFGFCANLLVNLLLIQQLGILAIALGALAATFASTLLLLLATYRRAGLSLRDMLAVVGGWCVWAGVCIALTSHSSAAFAISIIAVIGLGSAQYILLNGKAGHEPTVAHL